MCPLTLSVLMVWFVNASTDEREVKPLGVSMHEQGGGPDFPWLRALPMSSAGKAEKAIAAKSKVMEPMACGKAQKGESRDGSGHCHKRVSMMDRKEGDQARGTYPLKTADGGTHRNTERK